MLINYTYYLIGSRIYFLEPCYYWLIQKKDRKKSLKNRILIDS